MGPGRGLLLLPLKCHRKHNATLVFWAGNKDFKLFSNPQQGIQMSTFDPSKFSSQAKQQKDWEKKLNPNDHEAVQVYCGQPSNTVDGMYVDFDLLQLGIHTLVLAVVAESTGFSGRRTPPEVWGFIKVEHVQPEPDTTRYRVWKSICSSSLPISIKQPLSIHPSFNFYASIEHKGETTLDIVQSSILGRIRMYEQEQQQVDVDLFMEDKIGLSGVMAALLLMPPRTGENRRDLEKVWLRMEKRIMSARVGQCETSKLLKQAHCPIRHHTEKTLDSATWNRLCSWRPSRLWFFEIPLSEAASVLSKRECLLVSGRVFITTNSIPSVCKTTCTARLTLLLDEAKQRTKGDHTIDKRIRPLYHRVLNSLATLQSISSDALQIPRMAVSADKIVRLGPRCIKHLHALATNIAMKQHLKDAERLAFAQVLFMMGWNVKQIQRSWRPKFELAYQTQAQAENVLDEVGSKFKWIRASAANKPLSCSFFMSQGMCPFLREDSSSGRVKASKLCMASDTAYKQPPRSPLEVLALNIGKS
jgi:hypothetical protein